MLAKLRTPEGDPVELTLTTNGTASVNLSGTVANINSLLASANAVTYTPTSGYTGTAKLTMTTSDNGNYGTGGTLTDQDTVDINVTTDPLIAAACAAVFTSSSTGWNGSAGQVAVAIDNTAFANATIKLYVNSTLVQTATMSASGSYNGQSPGLSPSRLTVNNNDIVHGEFVVNGVTYVIGGGMKYLNPTFAGNGSGTQVAVTYATPLVLDLNGDGVQTVGLNESVQFDLTDSGTPQKSSWVDKQDGLLAMDLNGDGQINSGAELFGSSTKLADGSVASTGWAALAACRMAGPIHAASSCSAGCAASTSARSSSSSAGSGPSTGSTRRRRRLRWNRVLFPASGSM